MLAQRESSSVFAILEYIPGTGGGCTESAMFQLSTSHQGQLARLSGANLAETSGKEQKPQILPWLLEEDPARSLAQLRAKGRALLAATFPKASSPSSSSDQSWRSETEAQMSEQAVRVQFARCGPSFWL
eukprot:s382_g25.t1